MRKTPRILATGFMLLGLTLTSPGTAFADSTGTTGRPSGCSYGIAGDWGTWARCDATNGGSFRAIAQCKDVDTGRIQDYVGPWVKIVRTFAYCQGASTAVGAGIETKTS
ncbi:hypothetical protein SPRI_2130 [Streptomyces pristinaespiralis]|uniref:Secreted protein n=1 Tax=Streptomyces pristinaespiralis TaxID=38300 RepID=A0A0M5IPY4_STRPR|nr:hypothetical protein SPRI_2130 [Streptomyces pristinaespiralis]